VGMAGAIRATVREAGAVNTAGGGKHSRDGCTRYRRRRD